MAYLKLNRIYKVYPNGVKAVNDFSIDIEDKEFIVFVGPSGCGKSTTLRMIAGLEEITAGELFLEDKLINDIEPENRDIAMVFQNYALYPHMSVYDNMAFGLKNRKVKDSIIKEKIAEAVKILDLEGYLEKKPREMSGGQAQRVALGRAIVRNPKVFLFDEPLSNLDAKLRASMRSEITKLHKKLQTTFIYVTHDQVEAMTMGTRIVVMKDGFVQQIDKPMNLYYNPLNKFVAGFIGTPQMNFFTITLTRKKDKVLMNFADKANYEVHFDQVAKIDEKYLNGDLEIYLGVRPEHFSISKKKTGLSIVVNFYEQLGDEVIIYGNLESDHDDFKITEDNHAIIVKGSADDNIQIGDIINLAIKEDKFHLFDLESEISLLPTIPLHSSVDGVTKENKLNLFDNNIVMPPALLNKIKVGKKLQFEISPNAFVPGKDFSLPIVKIEKINDRFLAHLKYDNKYIFAYVSSEEKIGDVFNFSLFFDQIKVIQDDTVVLETMQQDIKIHGQLISKINKNGWRLTRDYRLELANIKLPLSKEDGDKIVAIDGRKATKKPYLLNLSASKIVKREEGLISGIISETFDYGHITFASLQIGEELVRIILPQELKDETSVSLNIERENLEIWHEQLDFRII